MNNLMAIQNLQTSFYLNFSIFAKARPMLTIITDRQTEMDKPIAIGKILHICLKITKKKLQLQHVQFQNKQKKFLFAGTRASLLFRIGTAPRNHQLGCVRQGHQDIFD